MLQVCDHRLTKAIIWAASCVVAFLACSPETGSDDGSPVVRDSAGVTLIETREPDCDKAPPVASLSGPALELGLADSPDQQFHRIRQTALWGDSLLIVADGGSNELRVFDRRGRHVRSLGGAGRGPGEFSGLNSFVLRADTLVAYDGGTRRVTFMALNGTNIRTMQLEAPHDPTHPILHRLSGIINGHLVLTARAYEMRMRSRPERFRVTVPTLIYTSEGSHLGVFAEPGGMDAYGTTEMAGNLSFGRRSSFAVHDDVVLVADGGTIDIRAYRFPDGLVRIIRSATRARPVPSSGIPADPRSEESQPWGAATTLPWIADLKVDTEGRLWVQVYKIPFRGDLRAWMLFDVSSGKSIGCIKVPAEFSLHHISGNRLIGVSASGGGVERVVVYELTWSALGSR
jgi:hypothetical protein